MLFELKLAACLGKTLGELRASVTSAELVLWAAYHQIEGLPQTRLEVATALAGTAAANSFGAKFQPKDLIPNFRPVIHDQKKGLQAFKAWAEAHKARP